MHQPLPPGSPAHSSPSFYLTGRHPLRPAVILLAIVLAAVALSAIVYALGRAGHAHHPLTANGASDADDTKDEKDDPNQIDTIVLGDPTDAPVPGRRHGNHVSEVHPTIVIRLPRFGPQTGLLPDTPAGHLLYSWLAAFNQASAPALEDILPGTAHRSAAAAQMKLRQQTGGFNLLSAKEVEPGIVVFRVRDQSALSTEALGTLQMDPNTIPVTIATFSLRSVP